MTGSLVREQLDLPVHPGEPTFILGSFRGLRPVRGSEIAAAFGAASELGTFTHQARGSYTNCAILIFRPQRDFLACVGVCAVCARMCDLRYGII